MKKQLLSGLSALVLSGAIIATTQASLSNEDQIKTRQSAYQFAAWNMGKIKAQVIDGDVEYNQAQVQAAANAIAAVANSGMGALYAPGTDKGTGWKKTRLKSDFFQQPERVREVAIGFMTAANELQKVAETGDKDAIARQFGAVGQSCKACHDDFRGR